MKAHKLFHLEYIKSGPSYITSDWFVEFFICKYIYEYYFKNKQYPLVDEVVNAINDTYGEENVYYVGISKFISNTFGSRHSGADYKYAGLTSNSHSSIEKVLKIRDRIQQLKNKLTQDDAKAQIQQIIERQDINLTELVALLILEESDEDLSNIDYYLALTYHTLKDGEYKTLTDIDKYVSCVKEEHYDRMLCDLTNDSQVIQLCNTFGLVMVGDITNLNIRAVLGLFIFCYDDFLEVFKFLNMSEDEIFQSLSQKLVDLFLVITSKEKKYLRDYYLNGLTLEQIGNKDALTRERVRQIIKKSCKKIVDQYPQKHLAVYLMYLQSIASEMLCGNHPANYNNEYLTEKLSEGLLILVAALYTQGADGLDYSLIVYFFNILGYKAYRIGTTNGRVEHLSKYESDVKYLIKSEYETLTMVDKQVVNKRFHKLGKYYLHNSIRLTDILVYLCDRFFSDGIRLSDSQSQHKLEQAYWNIFGCRIDLSNLDRRSGDLERRGYILAGRGLYRNKKYCPSIDDDLSDRINKYIVDNARPTLYYQMIFDCFREQLLSLNIDNYWLLKGLIDQNLPEFIIAHKDYVSNSNISNDTTAVSEMREFVRSFSGVFNVNNLAERFKGISPSIITNFLAVETRQEHLLALYNGNYIYYDKLGVSSGVKEEVKLYITDFFKSYKSKTVRSSVLYSNLRTRNPKLLENLREAGENQFALFSYLKESFSSEYIFNRPYISRSEEGDIPSAVNLLLNFIEDKDIVTNDEIDSFMQYMDIPQRHLAKFLNAAANTHVLIDSATLVKKESFDISKEQLDDLKTMLYTLTQRTGQFSTENFNGYSLFPKLKYKWNKYLISGIVRTFFSDIFNVKNTGIGYRDTDYIIRRKKQ